MIMALLIIWGFCSETRPFCQLFLAVVVQIGHQEQKTVSRS